MAKTKIRLMLTIYLSCFMSACVEQIDLEEYLTSKVSNTLVVEGILTNELKVHQIKLTRTGKALPDVAYEVVSGAQVSISDGSTTYGLTEYPLSSGIYVTDVIAGEVSKVYTLNIVVDGQTFVASDTMISVKPFGRAEGIVLGSNHPPKGYVETPLIIFGSNAPAMLTIKIDNPKPEDKYEQLNYYAFPGVDPDHVIPKYVDASLAYDKGTQLTQTKLSLSDSHYKFLRALLLETDYKGGIFGSVRANVPTNISNGAFGFFGACGQITRKGTIGEDGKLH